MPHARLAATLATTLATALLLVGCSSDPEPRVEPSATPSMTESSPTEDPRQAERAFIKIYVKAMSESLSSGNSSGFIELSSDQCSNCRTFADNLNDAYSDGGRILGGSWTVDRLDFGGETDAGALWFVDVRATRERWVDAEGATLKQVPAGVQLLAMTVTSSEATQQMLDVQFRTP